MEGTPFGRYRLIDQLGHGGMGEVWRAHDTAIDRTVAIKMLLPHFAKDEKFEQRFRREARAAARLENPHIVPIHDVGEIDGRLYVAMRLINGVDVQTLLDAGPLDPHRAVAIVEQVATALNAAHRVGLIHRDVKPSNILVDEDDFAYLIDFGIARAAGETGLTSTGATIGTWSYMAPERFSTGQAEASSDIYALACVLYQCLTGELPFPAVALEQIAMAHMITPPPQPSVTRAIVPSEMDTVIATGLAKDPAQRYPSTKQLAAAARSAITTVPDRPNPVPPPAPVPPAPTIGDADNATTHHAEATSPAPAQPLRPTTITAATVAASPPALRPAPGHLTGTTTGRAGGRRGLLVAAGVVAAVALVVGLGVVLKSPTQTARPAQVGPSSTFESPAPASAVPVPRTPTVEVLPFNVKRPCGIAVDGAGTVYVSSIRDWQAYKLTVGSNSPVLLPISNLNYPYGVAADHAGNVYLTDSGNGRVLKLAAGSTAPTALPFGASRPIGVAVDGAGAVYITDDGKSNAGVFKLAAGSNTPVRLPFDVAEPIGVAVDNVGNVYVTVSNSKVRKLAAGAGAAETLDFDGRAVAVDSVGNLYVTSGSNVMKYPPGSTIPIPLYFPDLSDISGLTVDDAGNLYVTTNSSSKVVKALAP